MLSKQYMSATSPIESSLWIEYSWLQITRTSRQLEVIFASLQIISMSLKKNGVLKSETLHSIQLKTTVSIFCPPLFFVTPVQIQCPSPVSYQALLLNSLFTISIFISCCLWSEVCMILAFLPHPFAYFRLFVSNSR